MAFVQIIPPGTGAVSTKADFDATLYQTVLIAADVLAGAETATIFVKVNGAYVPMANSAGTAAGLTATVAGVTLPGGVFVSYPSSTEWPRPDPECPAAIKIHGVLSKSLMRRSFLTV